ncbi:MAG: acyl carrier protein [Negativicutes bacterium]|nr:acyl carrier protein [Negativicutes bacterium]
MDVFEKLKTIIVEKLKVAPEKVTLASDFKADFQADSIDLFELVMTMEDSFGVELDDDAVVQIKTVGDAVAFLQAKM